MNFKILILKIRDWLAMIVYKSFFVKLFLFFCIFALPFVSFAETYGSNFLSGITPTCDSENWSECVNGNDANLETYWGTQTSFPHWIKYDLGSGITKIPAKISVQFYADVNGQMGKDFSLEISNDNSNWTTVISGTAPDYTPTPSMYSLEFPATSTASRYMRINVSNAYRAGNYMKLAEALLQECTSCSGNVSPTLSSISPSSVLSGSATTTITFNGSDFIASSSAFKSSSSTLLATTYVSPTVLEAVMPLSELVTAGTSSLGVYTPAPGGGISSLRTFTVYDSTSSPSSNTMSAFMTTSTDLMVGYFFSYARYMLEALFIVVVAWVVYKFLR